MYYNDLVAIKHEPIEVANSKRKSEAFYLRSCTIDELNKMIDKRVKSLKEKGMTLFALEFGSSEDDDGTAAPWCKVQGTRMETEDEMQERIARLEKYNEKVHEQRAKDKEQSDRRRELKRLTEHLTLDQLKAIKSIAT
jgi:hypothetical protein